jgi:hypothetical protein
MSPEAQHPHRVAAYVSSWSLAASKKEKVVASPYSATQHPRYPATGSRTATLIVMFDAIYPGATPMILCHCLSTFQENVLVGLANRFTPPQCVACRWRSPCSCQLDTKGALFKICMAHRCSLLLEYRAGCSLYHRPLSLAPKAYISPPYEHGAPFSPRFAALL